MSDVANLANVGTMTVSRVLSGKVFVSDEVRERVLKAVAKLKYQPNEVARSLRAQRTRQIGIIVPNLYNPFFAFCAHYITSVAQEHAYSTVITTSDEDPAKEFVEAKRMLRRHVEGMVIVPASGKTQLLDPEFKLIPLVTIDRRVAGSSFDSVAVQNKWGAQAGVQHLINLNHRRIALLEPKLENWAIQQRTQGYKATMAAAGLEPSIYLVPDSLSEMFNTVHSILESKERPTAFFCGSNRITRDILHVFFRTHVRIPEDIALVGFDDFEMADLIRPPITVVRQPVDAMGRMAAELLFSRLTIGKKRYAPKRIVLPVELIVRGSCGTPQLPNGVR
jgi:LacI family transcriptional regulator